MYVEFTSSHSCSFRRSNASWDFSFLITIHKHLLDHLLNGFDQFIRRSYILVRLSVWFTIYFPMITDRFWPNSLLSVKCSNFYWYETLVFFLPSFFIDWYFYVCYNANHILKFPIFKNMNDRRYDIRVSVVQNIILLKFY